MEILIGAGIVLFLLAASQSKPRSGLQLPNNGQPATPQSSGNWFTDFLGTDVPTGAAEWGAIGTGGGAILGGLLGGIGGGIGGAVAGGASTAGFGAVPGWVTGAGGGMVTGAGIGAATGGALGSFLGPGAAAWWNEFNNQF